MDERAEIYKVRLSADDNNDVRAFANGYVHEAAIVLDVGCACGDLGKLLKENKACQIHGFEYNPKSIEIAQKTGAYDAIHQVDLNSLDPAIFSQYRQTFDYIIVLDVLEHLVDPGSVLQRLAQFLKPSGAMIISLPNVAFCDIKAGLLRDTFEYTDTGILDRTHLRFFTRSSVSSLFTEMGFSVDSLKLKLCYHGKPTRDLPWLVRRMITGNPNSYVYQYVAKICKESNLEHDALDRHNTDKMRVDWGMIEEQYRVLRNSQLMADFLPAGSVRHRLARFIRRNILSR